MTGKNSSNDSSLRSTRSTDRPLNKSVSFHEITVYEFPLRIGDNPACTAGCPIALAKKHNSVRKSSISDNDENEANNTKSTTRRRSRDLIIPSDIRTKLLMESGYELQRIVKTTEDILKIQEQRRESLQKTSWEGVKSFFQPNVGKISFKSTPSMNLAGATTA
jgi:hypothetical protein